VTLEKAEGAVVKAEAVARAAANHKENNLIFTHVVMPAILWNPFDFNQQKATYVILR
jgi:hypothetical protein